jgi:polyhydroxyalkanoate synthesis regulator phasin
VIPQFWTEQLTQLMRESVNASVETAVKFQQQTWRMVDELVQRGAVGKDEGMSFITSLTNSYKICRRSPARSHENERRVQRQKSQKPERAGKSGNAVRRTVPRV